MFSTKHWNILIASHGYWLNFILWTFLNNDSPHMFLMQSSCHGANVSAVVMLNEIKCVYRLSNLFVRRVFIYIEGVYVHGSFSWKLWFYIVYFSVRSPWIRISSQHRLSYCERQENGASYLANIECKLYIETYSILNYIVSSSFYACNSLQSILVCWYINIVEYSLLILILLYWYIVIWNTNITLPASKN